MSLWPGPDPQQPPKLQRPRPTILYGAREPPASPISRSMRPRFDPTSRADGSHSASRGRPDHWRCCRQDSSRRAPELKRMPGHRMHLVEVLAQFLDHLLLQRYWVEGKQRCAILVGFGFARLDAIEQLPILREREIAESRSCREISSSCRPVRSGSSPSHRGR